MNEELVKTIAPLFEVYGSACFDAQHLEKGIKLLILISDPHKTNLPKFKKMTLGDLHKLVSDKNYFTHAETKIINDAIKERNILVHNCWENYIQRSMSVSGRKDVKEDVLKKKYYIRKASSIIDEFIDNHIKKYNFNLGEFGDNMISLLSDNSENILH